jgi:hypothetical protein
MMANSPVEVPLSMERINIDALGTDPVQAQRALACVDGLITRLDGTLRLMSEPSRKLSRKVLALAKECRDALEPLAHNSFTNGTRHGYRGSQARRLYRRLLKLLAEWTHLQCPEAERFIRALAE